MREHSCAVGNFAIFRDFFAIFAIFRDFFAPLDGLVAPFDAAATGRPEAGLTWPHEACPKIFVELI